MAPAYGLGSRARFSKETLKMPTTDLRGIVGRCERVTAGGYIVDTYVELYSEYLLCLCCVWDVWGRYGFAPSRA